MKPCFACCLMGGSLGQSDIAVACTLLSLYKQVMDPAFRDTFGNARNHWLNVGAKGFG